MSLGKAVSRRILDFCREHNKSIDIVLQKSNASPTEVAAVLDGRDALAVNENVQNNSTQNTPVPQNGTGV